MSCVAAVLDDVPDDQEIAGEVEPADELELVLDLLARAHGQRALAVARRAPALGQLAQDARAASWPGGSGNSGKR